MNESTVVHHNQPCLNEECGSSDAMQVYSDGHSYCFSCNTRFKGDDEEFASDRALDIVDNATKENKDLDALKEISNYPSDNLSDRFINKSVCDFFGVKVSYDINGNIETHYYPFHDSAGRVTGYKVRRLPKTFSVKGKVNGLFGQNKFGGGKKIVITEGECDTLAVAQAFTKQYNGKIYPVVSIPTGAASSGKYILEHRAWLRSFDDVVLMFDQDEVGQEGANQVAKLIGADKVRIANFSAKDPNDLLITEGYKEVCRAIWDATPWSPAGIMYSSETWDIYKKELEADYVPWPDFAPDLNKMSYGRRMGSITMLTSGTGMGKSSFLKEDQYHLLNTTDSKIGICSLEESLSEAVGGIMSLHANKRIGLPDVEISDEEERKLWEETMGEDRFMFLDHQGSVSDDSLTDKIEYMALCGCKFIYLDHITIAVSESDGDDINKATDKLMSDLLKICKRHNVWIGVVSHLRKTNNNQKSFEEGAVPSDDDLKGSGSLKQIAFQIIAISRSKIEEDPAKRNLSKLWVLKDRFTGRTGPAGQFRFVEETGRLRHTDGEEDFEETLTL